VVGFAFPGLLSENTEISLMMGMFGGEIGVAGYQGGG